MKTDGPFSFGRLVVVFCIQLTLQGAVFNFEDHPFSRILQLLGLNEHWLDESGNDSNFAYLSSGRSSAAEIGSAGHMTGNTNVDPGSAFSEVVAEEHSPDLMNVDTQAVSRYQSMLEELSVVPPRSGFGSSKGEGECPPAFLTMEDGTYLKPKKPFASGSKTSLFKYTKKRVGGTDLLVVKVLDAKAPESLRKALQQEKAFLSLFEDEPLFPHLFTVNDIEAECKSRTMVTSFEGTTELADMKPAAPTEVARIAAAAIALVRTVHERGFIHGDIHKRQFLFSNPKNVAGTLRLIDYGRVSAFVNMSNQAHLGHISDQLQSVEKVSWNEVLLSPWELERKSKTRRDDFFRLAEMFIKLLPTQDKPFRRAAKQVNDRLKKKSTEYAKEILALKRERPFASDVPQILKDFYKYCLGLGNAERPDYEGWIARFTTFAEARPPAGFGRRKPQQITTN